MVSETFPQTVGLGGLLLSSEKEYVGGFDNKRL